MTDLEHRVLRLEEQNRKLLKRTCELKSYFMSRGWRRQGPIRYYRAAQDDLKWLRARKDQINAALKAERDGERIVRLTAAERYKLMRLIEVDFRRFSGLDIFSGKKNYVRRMKPPAERREKGE